jgi:hypothetical protein
MDSMTWLVTIGFFALIFGGLGMWIASVKRRSEAEGCALGCLLGPFGALIEALLPSQAAPETPGPATQASESTRKCPDCAETIKAEAHVCRFCGARFTDDEVAAAVARARERFVANPADVLASTDLPRLREHLAAMDDAVIAALHDRGPGITANASAWAILQAEYRKRWPN